jgi:hypothetical protein
MRFTIYGNVHTYQNVEECKLNIIQLLINFSIENWSVQTMFTCFHLLCFYISSKSSKLPGFELLKRSGRSLSMDPHAREVGFGLLKIWYLSLDLFFC